MQTCRHAYHSKSYKQIHIINSESCLKYILFTLHLYFHISCRWKCQWERNISFTTGLQWSSGKSNSIFNRLWDTKIPAAAGFFFQWQGSSDSWQISHWSTAPRQYSSTCWILKPLQSNQMWIRINIWNGYWCRPVLKLGN